MAEQPFPNVPEPAEFYRLTRELARTHVRWATAWLQELEQDDQTNEPEETELASRAEVRDRARKIIDALPTPIDPELVTAELGREIALALGDLLTIQYPDCEPIRDQRFVNLVLHVVGNDYLTALSDCVRQHADLGAGFACDPVIDALEVIRAAAERDVLPELTDELARQFQRWMPYLDLVRSGRPFYDLLRLAKPR